MHALLQIELELLCQWVYVSFSATNATLSEEQVPIPYSQQSRQSASTQLPYQLLSQSIEISSCSILGAKRIKKADEEN